MEWEEVNDMGIVTALGYYWPSDNTSGGTSTFGPQLNMGKWNHGKQSNG